MPLSLENENQIETLLQEGYRPDEVAAKLELPRVEVRAYARQFGTFVPPAQSTILDVPVRPLAIPPFEAPPPLDFQRPIRALLYGDSQFPFQDDGALSIVQQISRDLQPDVIVHMGDIVDCYSISDYDRDPHRSFTLQDEINMARVHLGQMRVTNPRAQFHLYEGNHEDRFRRLLWRLKGTATELLSLNVIQRELTWPRLLGLDQLGVAFYPYNGRQAGTPVLPKFSIVHGNLVRKFSAYSARGQMEKYGRSGASGHTHRLGVHYHQNHSGNYCWFETGCTCKTDAEYTQNPDWQQGCVVATFDPETGAFSPEPIYIHNALAVWRGNIYRA